MRQRSRLILTHGDSCFSAEPSPIQFFVSCSFTGPTQHSSQEMKGGATPSVVVVYPWGLEAHGLTQPNPTDAVLQLKSQCDRLNPRQSWSLLLPQVGNRARAQVR